MVLWRFLTTQHRPLFAVKTSHRNKIPNFEARNPKQIQGTKSQNPDGHYGLGFGALDLGFVSDFGIRASDFAS